MGKEAGFLVRDVDKRTVEGIVSELERGDEKGLVVAVSIAIGVGVVVSSVGVGVTGDAVIAVEG